MRFKGIMNIRKKIREKQLNKLVSEILEFFPGTEKEEITVKYEPFPFKKPTVIRTNFHPSNSKELRHTGEIRVRKYFFKFWNEKEQKAILIHELGHYEYNKRKCKTPETADMRRDWTLQRKGILKRRHSYERLETQYLLKEIKADNYVLGTGYEKALISHHKKISLLCTEQGKKIMEARIANLEEKLGAEKYKEPYSNSVS